MAIAVTTAGGANSAHALSPAERNAAQQALARLTNSNVSGTKSVASALSGISQNATLSGGAKAVSVTAGSKLLVDSSTHAFSGVSAAKLTTTGVGNDTVVSGSFKATTATSGTHGSALSTDTINVAGQTAAGVKAHDVASSKSATATITLGDKTTVTLTGIPTHNVVKPH